MGKNESKIYVTLRKRLVKVKSLLILLEKFYFMPNRIFGFAFNIAWNLRELQAMRDKRYRDLKRKSKKSSEFNDLMASIELREKLAPEGRVIALLRAGKDLKLSLALVKVIEWVDLLGRGFTERDIWSLDESMALRIGNQLLELERITHGWPESQEFKTFEDWSKSLIKHGTALVKYGRKDFENEKLLDIALKLKNAGEEDEYLEIIERIHLQEHVAMEDTKLAYIFIAENFKALWD